MIYRPIIQLIALVSLSVTVVTLTSTVFNADQVETKVIRAKREPQHFLGVIIESALTGQHHGFGHRPPFYGYGNSQETQQPQRHWWIPQWWPKSALITTGRIVENSGFGDADDI